MDDEPVLRKSMSLVFTEIGYQVRCAEDGFSALAEIRREVPDVLISDLHMPRMSGFELLSVVQQRFPAIRTIAMSGAFWGDETPSGVAADAFYQKGSGFGTLLRILRAFPQTERIASELPSLSTPTLARQSGQGSADDVTTASVVCKECLRSYPATQGGSISSMRETDCIFCSSSIHHAIAQAGEWAAA